MDIRSRFTCRDCRFAAWCLVFRRGGDMQDTLSNCKCVQCGRLWGNTGEKLIDLSKHTMPVGRSTGDLSTCPRCGAGVDAAMRLIWRSPSAGCWEFVVWHRQNTVCDWGEITWRKRIRGEGGGHG